MKSHPDTGLHLRFAQDGGAVSWLAHLTKNSARAGDYFGRTGLQQLDASYYLSLGNRGSTSPSPAGDAQGDVASARWALTSLPSLDAPIRCRKAPRFDVVWRTRPTRLRPGAWGR